jgi:4-hydroxythreonine-4-phosphate dehydrogenase
MERPLLAVTMGDPAGVGPETIVGAWPDAAIHSACRAVVMGHPGVMRRAAALVDKTLSVVEITSPDEVPSDATTVPCLACCAPEAEQVRPATIDARGGQAAFDALRAAADWVRSRQADAIVTGPLHKGALWAAGHRYPGHTELLAEWFGADEVAMMLYLESGGGIAGRVGLGVVHATLHVPLREAIERLTSERIATCCRLADGAVRSLLACRALAESRASADSPDSAGHHDRQRTGEPPRIGVCALNPHAGEGGLFGDEEQRIIAPAVAVARREGILIEGPLPADTLLMRAAGGEFDAVVAMYHDQGHIALKLLGMHRAVNVTLGLPVVRTSVAHGTAFDLAWQRRAESGGMQQAMLMAARLASSSAADQRGGTGSPSRSSQGAVRSSIS